MNRPLLLPALCLAAGIGADETLGLALAAWLGGALLALLLALAWPRGRPAGIAAGWLLAGGLAHAIEVTPLAPDDLRRIEGTEPRLAEIRGIIAETPTLRLSERHGQVVGRTVVRLEVSAWRPPDGPWQPASGAVMTATRGVFPDVLFRGRRVEVSGVLEVPPGPVAPGLFDYQAYLRHSGIWRTLEVAAVDDWHPVAGTTVKPPLSERFLPWAQQALARGLPDDESTRLLWAMTLGWRTALAGDVNQAFMEAGTMHVFAISGLHIALISGMIVALLRAFRIPRRVCGVVAVPAAWFYVAATGWQPSAVRSAVMMTAVVGSWTLNRPGDLLNSLALAALVILVPEPSQLFEAGFQLSFGVVGGLALLVPRIEPWFLRRLQFNSDPFLPDELRPRWQRWLDAPLRVLALTLSTGTAAFLSSLPLTVQYFHLLSPVTLLANLLVVPLSSLALAANAASLAVTAVWPDLAEVFNASAWLWMSAMDSLSRRFAALPGGVWYVAAPAWPWWAAYYAGLAAMASGWCFTPKRRRWCALAGGVVIGTALVAFGWSKYTTVVTVFPAGEAVVIEAPWGRSDLVLNPGGVRAGTSIVTPFLHARGWNRVPLLAVAQADAAHLGGGTNFVAQFRPGELAVPNVRLRSPVLRRLLETAEDWNVPIRTVHRGAVLAGWSVLSPDTHDEFRTAEDNALVLVGETGGLRLLWLSQLGRLAQRALIDREAATSALAADIVVAGLPHDGEPLRDDLLAAIRPQAIIITSAKFPAGQHAHPALRERLARVGAPVLYLEDMGTLTLRLRGGRAELEGMDGTRLELHAPR